MRALVALLGGVFFLSSTLLAQPPLPQYDDIQHLGAVTCAGSTCHGATEPFANSSVLQNEYTTWVRQDSHANAYNVLLNEESQRIARNLGLEAAHSADLCLDCHADNVPENQRGGRFQISDGVSCEACHGGSENYLGPHTSGKASHQDNIALGLYPTEDPKARAELCLSCHLGTQDKFVTHRIMGAGHPRMSFELETFTAIQPAHYAVDADYRERKTLWSGVQTWAIGQAVAVANTMENFLDPQLHRDAGLFPELTFFDCFACHHSLNDIRWAPRSSAGLGPGVVRFNDSGLLMLTQILRRVDPQLGAALGAETVALHRATGQSMTAAQDVARRIIALAEQAEDRIAAYRFGGDDMKAILDGLVSLGLRGEQRDYATAEQGVMAISSIANTLDGAALLNDAQRERLGAALDRLYGALANEDTYQPQQLVTALEQLQTAYK